MEGRAMKLKTYLKFMCIAAISCLTFMTGCKMFPPKVPEANLETLESTLEITQITMYESADFNPVLSPDGKQLLFVSQKHGNDDIFGSGIFAKNRRQVTVSASAESNPVWTPDGKEILFDSDRLGFTAVFRLDLKRPGIIRQIVARGASDSAPGISPDGKQIAFGSGGTASLWLADANNGTDLIQIGEGGLPKWSPDGKSIIFTSSKSGNADIWSIKPDGGELTQLTVDVAEDVAPCWSPDQKKIVFSSNRSGNFDLWVLNLETNEYNQLTDHPADDGGPEWSPDGKYIYFHSIRSGNLDLWRLTPPKD
jgi:Tol biopolymer transport system component